MPGVNVILIILAIAAYWAPTLVAWLRHVPNAGSVTVVNLFLGWTLAGWVVALAMAVRSRPQRPAGPPVAAPQPAPQRQPGAGGS